MQIFIADKTTIRALDLPDGARVLDALIASGFDKKTADFIQNNLDKDINPRNWRVGIYGKKCRLDAPLAPFDRVEIYEPLIIDPKARRARLTLGR